jgi:uncharacterized protein (TIGR00106 family)
MSVLLEFSMFPIAKGEGVSVYVGRIIKKLEEEGIEYQLTPMCTIIETESLKDALKIIEMAYEMLEADCNRVYTSVTFDIRKGQIGRISKKIESVKKRIEEASCSSS